MDMAGRFEDIIQKQEALIAALEEQHAADQKLIHLQEQQIPALQEKTVLGKKNRHWPMRETIWPLPAEGWKKNMRPAAGTAGGFSRGPSRTVNIPGRRTI